MAVGLPEILSVQDEELKVKIIIEIMNKPAGPSKERCEYCMSYKRELCNGKGHIFENFEPAPQIDDDDLKSSPKEGDATRIRMKVGEKKDKYRKI